MTFPPGTRAIPDADAEMCRRAADRQLPEHVTLEERVAALEALACPTALVSPAGPLTEETLAQFREDLAAAMRGPYAARPPGPLLTPEAARELAREYVAIMEPGELLLIRVPDDWTVQQVHETQVRLNDVISHRGLGVTILLLPGEEFAIARPA